MKGLSNYTTRELAEALGKRSDLAEMCVRPDGMVDPAIWPLRVALGAIPCVDAIAIRVTADSSLEGGIIRRKTGRFPNKLAFIGGVVGKYESREAALRRHWKTDLGVEIEFPLGIFPVEATQYAPQIDGRNRKEFRHDPGKHSFAETYLVSIINPEDVTLGSTDYGGQEAAGLEWYGQDNCPTGEEWSYDMRPGFLFALTAAVRAKNYGGTTRPFR